MTGPLDEEGIADLDFRVLILLACGKVDHLVIDLSAVECCDRAVLAELCRIRTRLAACHGTVEIFGVRVAGRDEPLPAAALDDLLDTCDDRLRR